MDVKSFWERTNSLLKEKGFTQQSLAIKCGFSIRRIENLSTKKFPTITESIQMAKELGTSIEYLVNGVTDLECDLLFAFNQLNDVGKQAAIGAVKGLYSIFPMLSAQDGESTKTAT
jgi:transcriptional regulator with XRE-family HTH domain